MAWACTGADYGTPQTPPAPPAPASVVPAPATVSPAPAPSVVPSSSASSSASGSTSGASSVVSGSTGAHGSTHVSTPVSGGQRSSGPGASGAVGQSPSFGSSGLAARQRGATAGVSSQGGRAVFASSVAPPRARVAHHAVARHAVVAAAPSPRSATGDVWGGFGAPARSSVSVASASASGQASGVGSQTLAGMVILGLGLVGLLGGALVAGSRRRRASARSGR